MALTYIAMFWLPMTYKGGAIQKRKEFPERLELPELSLRSMTDVVSLVLRTRFGA
jgi:hypothetical protein